MPIMEARNRYQLGEPLARLPSPTGVERSIHQSRASAAIGPTGNQK